MERRGVCYDVGRYLYGDWRKDYSPKTVHRELEIIRDDLHCNAVRIHSRDLGRLEVTAEDALRLGLEVWFSPELWNRQPGATLAYTVEAAVIAERLQLKYPGRLVMNVGNELSLFMKGIIPGRSLWSRMRQAIDAVRADGVNGPLNDFLSSLVTCVREVYGGQLTYASLPFEKVNWEPFDFIGIDHYRSTQNSDHYADTLKPLLAQGKPVAILEFGSCAYQGAEHAGGQAFNIVDIKTAVMHGIPLFGRFVQPRLKGHYVRDEALQALEILESLEIFENLGVDGAFIHTFVFPQNPYDENPIHDLDMASYSLVKTYEAGKRGVTYPDMTWEPKESFDAVAQFYGELQGKSLQ
jgi:hypothetical protein